jgi:hypothetical protein
MMVNSRSFLALHELPLAQINTQLPIMSVKLGQSIRMLYAGDPQWV